MVQFETILLSMPVGVCVAKIIPSPYLRACAASAMVLSLHGVVFIAGAKFCASSSTNSRPVGLGLRLIQVNSDICS